MPDTIQDRVLKVIATTKRIPLESVHPDSTFEALGIDSLDRLNILFDLESEFDVEINDDDAKKVQNIHEMVLGIQHLLDAKSNPKSDVTTNPNAEEKLDANSAKPSSSPTD